MVPAGDTAGGVVVARVREVHLLSGVSANKNGYNNRYSSSGISGLKAVYTVTDGEYALSLLYVYVSQSVSFRR